MRWLARVVAVAVVLGTLVGCYSSGAVVQRTPPANCIDWEQSPGDGYCRWSKSDAMEAQRGYYDYLADEDYEEYQEEYAEYMNDPANHGYADYNQSDNRWNCDDLSSQSAAQAILASDRSDPNNLDGDHDGRACQ